MIGRFINQGGSEIGAAALAQFNEKSFERIGRLVFREGANSVSIDQFSATTLTRLVKEGGKFDFCAAVLGQAATEEFVKTVLLPELAENLDHGWIRDAIEIAGDRHNRRYLLSDS